MLDRLIVLVLPIQPILLFSLSIHRLNKRPDLFILK